MNLKEKNLVNTEYIHWIGRTLYSEEELINTIYHNASGFEFYFKGNKCNAIMQSTNYLDSNHRPYIAIIIDSDINNCTTLAFTQKEQEITLFQSTIVEKHKITVLKLTESIDSIVSLKEIIPDKNGLILPYEKKENQRVVEVFGDSTTSGYGNLGLNGDLRTTANTNGLKDFIFQACNALGAEVNMFTASGWGVCGSIWTTPKDIRFVDYFDKLTVFSNTYWDYTIINPDLIIFSLGSNDMYYIEEYEDQKIRSQRLADFINTYSNMIKFSHDTYPHAKIIIIYGVMNESRIYDGIKEVYNRAKQNISELYLLKVTGDLLGIDFHPSLASHNEMAGVLKMKIKEIMRW